MENSELVVPTNSRIDDSPANGISELKKSPSPPKTSPVSSVSRLSLTSRPRQDDNKTVQCEEIRHETSSCGNIEEEKEVVDILKSRLYDSAGTSDVYRSLRAQVLNFFTFLNVFIKLIIGNNKLIIFLVLLLF